MDEFHETNLKHCRGKTIDMPLDKEGCIPWLNLAPCSWHGRDESGVKDLYNIVMKSMYCAQKNDIHLMT